MPQVELVELPTSKGSVFVNAAQITYVADEGRLFVMTADGNGVIPDLSKQELFSRLVNAGVTFKPQG